LVDMLREAKLAKGVQRTLLVGGIRQYMLNMSVAEVLRAIEEIDDPEMLKILIGAGPPGRAYHAALAKLRQVTV